MGRIYQVGNAIRVSRAPAGAPREVLVRDIATPETLARTVSRLADDLADTRGKTPPPYVEFEDVTLPGGGAEVAFPHGLGGRVRYWHTDWTAGAGPPRLRVIRAKTTRDVLVVASLQACTATIRVEALS